MAMRKSLFDMILVWAPRALGAAFTVFLSLFATDVFDQGGTFLESLGAFLVHLGPVYLVVAALALAWKWPLLGAVFFAGLAAAYVIWQFGSFPWHVYLAISGPPLLIAVLFFASWLRTRKRADAAALGEGSGR